MGLFSNFFGGDSRKDIRRSQAQANSMLDTGRDTAQGYFDQGYEDSRGYIDPFVESGGQASEFYDNLLGINGADARGDAQGVLTSDPMYNGALSQQQNAMLRNMNARGLGASGRSQLAAERVFQQNYGNTLNRYAGRAGQGQQAAGMGANLATGYGNNSANLQYGTAQQKAGNAISAGNAMSATRNTGMNNMLGIAGLGLKAYGMK